MAAYITDYSTKLDAGTYTEYRIDGINAHGKLPLGTTSEEAVLHVEALNAQYGKYGPLHVHTLRARTVTVGEWE